MKLNKFLAHAGCCSRRNATELIKAGHVKVKGVVVKEPFYDLLDDDTVKLKNKLIVVEKKLYFLFNKPKDVLCTLADTKERNTVAESFSKIKARLYPVGRLDRNTTGLLLMTNDGELTQKLSHPKFKVAKTYQVTTHRVVEPESLDRLLKGIKLDDGFMKVDQAIYASKNSKDVVLVTIHSGKKHVIKRLFGALKYFVEKLDRINFAGLTKKGLPLGHYRALTPQEIKMLQNL
jgi:23S rRNA pseudouridine2605 synthase